MKLLVNTLVIFFMSMSAYASASITADLQSCVSENNDKKRLACFDQLSKSYVNSATNIVKSQTAAKKAVAVSEVAVTIAKPPTNPVKEVKQDIAKKEDIFGAEYKTIQNGLEQLSFTIKSVKKNPYGQRRFTFENGQVWQQKDGTTAGKYSVGSEVTIKRGVLNSFYLKKEGSNRTLKVKRVK